MQYGTTIAVAAALAMGAIAQTSASPDKWRAQFFHDKYDSTLAFTDIKCPAPGRCLASGVITDGKHRKGTLVVTSDGGAHWTYQETKDLPAALFFHDATNGWMITDKDAWRTADGGVTWTKLGGVKGAQDIYFADLERGWVARPGGLEETTDGGKNWKKVHLSSTEDIPSKTMFDSIAMAHDKRGIVSGTWSPDKTPIVWAAPELLEWSSLERTILLETKDGGNSWSAAAGTMRGSLSHVQYDHQGRAMAIIEGFWKTADAPELVRYDYKNKSWGELFRNKRRAVRDYYISPSGEIFVAAVEPPGALANSPIPGKLKILRSGRMLDWKDMDVDYRAVAADAYLAGNAQGMWVATDTGMILHCGPVASPQAVETAIR